MGQCCCAGSRTYVHESIYDEFVKKAKARALQRVVGDPFRVGVEQGPQVNEEQFHQVLSLIESGQPQGANLLTGGGCLGSKGYFIKPIIFTDVNESMKIVEEDIFGPVQSIMKFKKLDEVAERANNSIYGLAPGIFSKNLNTVNTLSRALRAGTIWVNCYHVFHPTIPFGGYKQSGIGREEGKYVLENYTQEKAVVTPLHNLAWL